MICLRMAELKWRGKERAVGQYRAYRTLTYTSPTWLFFSQGREVFCYNMFSFRKGRCIAAKTNRSFQYGHFIALTVTAFKHRF